MRRINGSRLRYERDKACLTQAELAEKAGIALSQLSRMENGQSPGSARTIRKLAVALLVLPDQFTDLDAPEVDDGSTNGQAGAAGG